MKNFRLWSETHKIPHKFSLPIVRIPSRDVQRPRDLIGFQTFKQTKTTFKPCLFVYIHLWFNIRANLSHIKLVPEGIGCVIRHIREIKLQIMWSRCQYLFPYVLDNVITAFDWVSGVTMSRLITDTVADLNWQMWSKVVTRSDNDTLCHHVTVLSICLRYYHSR